MINADCCSGDVPGLSNDLAIFQRGAAAAVLKINSISALVKSLIPIK